MRLILHAPNVHQGGGRALLTPLLNAAATVPCFALLDARFDADIPDSITVRRIHPTVFHRIAADRFLQSIARPEDVVLCFGNLPPLFALPSKVVVFLQNRYLIDPDISLDGFPIRSALRLRLERRWLSLRRSAVHLFIVQSESMGIALAEHFGVGARVLPFAPIQATPDMLTLIRANSVRYDFLYVASGEPHKNHRKLVEAWVLLAADDLRPHLCLTLNRRTHADLCTWIDQQTTTHKLQLTNISEIDPEDVVSLYRDSGALIYPSTMESFGLPLFEAMCAGLPVLAAERDYVRDLMDPAESFDPDSARSIVHAVKRFLKLSESRPTVLDASGFVQQLMREVFSR